MCYDKTPQITANYRKLPQKARSDTEVSLL